MRAVNLLPPEARGRSGPGLRLPAFSAPLTAGAIGLVLVVLVLAGYLSARSDVSDKQAALEDRRAALAALPLPPRDVPVPPTLAAERTSRATAIGTAMTSRIAWDRILRKVSQVLLSETWLTGLTGTSPAADAAAAIPAEGAPTGLVLNGFTTSHEAVARTLGRLAVVPDLADVSLQTSSAAEIGRRPVVQFTIAANVRSGSSG